METFQGGERQEKNSGSVWREQKRVCKEEEVGERGREGPLFPFPLFPLPYPERGLA